MAVNQETLQKLGRFLLRGLRIGASTVAVVELLRNDLDGSLMFLACHFLEGTHAVHRHRPQGQQDDHRHREGGGLMA